MFKRPHHQKIARVLYRLNAPLLKELQCYFGGGTAIALRYGEFRESVDIDFLVSDLKCYRQLRQMLNVNEGLEPLLFPDGEPIPVLRDVRTDHYGIRTLLGIDDQQVKFEIIFEARVSLDSPKSADQICRVSCLTAQDMFVEKLLSNSDRWRDDSVFSRDLLDLAMIDLPNKAKRAALSKAEHAYGSSVRDDLIKAIDRMEKQPDWLEYCRKTLSIQFPQAVLWKPIRQLRTLL